MYPSGGPGGPVIPPGDRAYELLTRKRCSALLATSQRWLLASTVPEGDRTSNHVEDRLVYLYRAAANACLGRWQEAVRNFDQLSAVGAAFGSDDCPPPDNLQDGDCPKCEKAVFAWLTEVVQAYRSDPAVPPVLVDAPSGAQLC